MLKDSSIVNIETWSLYFWGVYAGYVIICLLVVIYSNVSLNREISLKKSIKYPDFQGDVTFSRTSLAIICFATIISGAIAAIIGIGGSIIYIPIMLMIGYPPSVASNTSIFIVMYSALGNVVLFALRGSLNYSYGGWMSIWTLVGVIFGKILQKDINFE